MKRTHVPSLVAALLVPLLAPLLAGLAVLLPLNGVSQAEPETRHILVTPVEEAAEPLTATELDLRVGRQPADIVSFYQPQERPVRLALLIADNTGAAVAQSLPELADFIRSLPRGSDILVGYARRGSVDVAKPFTIDRETAAASLRIPAGSPHSAPSDLGQLIIDLLKEFPAEPLARDQVLYIGEGTVPDSGTLYNDPRLNRAIRRAQERGLVVWAIHVGGETASHDLAESYLERLSRETGGRTFALGLHPPTLAPYLKELRGLLDQQCLVEFAPGEKPTGKLEIKVRGRKLRLLHPQR